MFAAGRLGTGKPAGGGCATKAWKYILDTESYRPILALLLLVLNVVSYKEDPTSYSWTKFRNPTIGYIHNHAFTKYSEASEMGASWLVFKLVMVFVYPITFAICVEFFIRRLILWRMLKCSGFKRDKGAFVLFVVSIAIGLYTGALLFNTTVRNVEYLSDLQSAKNAVLAYYGGDDHDDSHVLSAAVFNASYVASILPDRCNFTSASLEQSVHTMNTLYETSRVNPEHIRYDMVYCGFPATNESLDDFLGAVDELDFNYNDYPEEYETRNDIETDKSVEGRKKIVSDCLKQVLMVYGVKILPGDSKFNSGGYCYYVWSNILGIDEKDIMSSQHKNKTTLDKEIFLNTLLLDEDVGWLSEGLFNRLSSLATFLCDAWTLFAIFDEWAQKRGRVRYSSSRATASKMGVPNRICSWYNMRIQVFWIFILGVLVFSTIHVTASVNYHTYGHRCEDLKADDFDNPVAFNSIFLNVYDGSSNNTLYRDDASFRMDFDISPSGYDAVAFRTTTSPIPEGDDKVTTKCQTFWNDKHVLGFGKSGRIILSAVILLLDLILVLFVSEFPTFQNDLKICKKHEMLKTIPPGDTDTIEHRLRCYNVTRALLQDKSLTYLDRRNILRRFVDVICCNRDVYIDKFDFEFVPFIPGLNTTDIYFPSFKSVLSCFRNPLKTTCPRDTCDLLCCNPSYGASSSRLAMEHFGDDASYDVFADSTDEESSDDAGGACFKIRKRLLRCGSSVCEGLKLLCCFCCYESCLESREVARGNTYHKRKSAITAKWLIYGALIIASTLNMLSLIQQCTFEPVSFDQVETTDGSIHQLKNEAFDHNQTQVLNSTNLCMVCPKGIRKKSDPMSPSVESWYPTFETVEWVDLDTITKFGDITKAYTESKMNTSGLCFVAFGNDLWTSETSTCDSWDAESDIDPVFVKHRTFNIGNNVCHMKKKIKWKCGCSGYHEHEKPIDPMSRHQYVNDSSLEPSFAQRDCNYDTSHGPSAFWNGENVAENGLSKKDKRWYFDISPKKEEYNETKSTYCLKMDVLEWMEIVCDSGVVKNETLSKLLDIKHGIAQLEATSSSVFYNEDIDCWSCASKSMQHPSYAERFDNTPTFNYAETSWGLESSNAFEHRYFWVGEVSNNGDWYEDYFYPKDLAYRGNDTTTPSAFGIRKSSVSCKITTCPIGSYNVYNDERNVIAALYITIIPAVIGCYMIWVMFWNHCAEIALKELYKIFPKSVVSDSAGGVNPIYNEGYTIYKVRSEKERCFQTRLTFYRGSIRLALCMMCKCKSFDEDDAGDEDMRCRLGKNDNKNDNDIGFIM